MASVFGPVVSWRLGRSLGVDLAPFKTCNWNCVYCQLGRSWPVTDTPNPRPSAPTVLAELDERLSHLDDGEVDWITILGSGEPLLYAGLGEVLEGIRARTSLPVAVLTNGALLSRPGVRESVMSADVLMPSLCCGSALLFKRLNRPHPRIPYQEHLDGLRRMRARFQGRIWLEVMLVAGANDDEEALRSLAKAIADIAPDEIHLNVPTRPPAEPWVRPPDLEAVGRAREILGAVAPVRIHGDNPPLHPSTTSLPPLTLQDLVSVLQRHPMTAEELRDGLEHDDRGNLEAFLTARALDGSLRPVRRLGKEFWVPGKAHFPDENACPPRWMAAGEASEGGTASDQGLN